MNRIIGGFSLEAVVDIVLGVSMTSTAARLVLVEGETADGAIVDHDSFEFAAGADAPDQVLAAILGTRESAAEGGHHLTCVGVAWTDRARAARLRQVLRANDIDDVVLVSELHAASALARAVGWTIGCDRTALLFVERDTATLAVVNADDGAVVHVNSRTLHTADAIAELQGMVAGLDGVAEPAQALFVVGSGIDIAALEPHIAACTTLPVHAPEDGDLALARGAALASANAPRYDAATVGLAPAEDTAAGPTQMAAAGYMAPLGYSAVDDDGDDLLESLDDDDSQAGESGPDGDLARRRFALVGGALSTVLVIGMVALAITLAVVIRPTADQRPDPVGNAVLPSGQPPASADRATAGPAAPETIRAPIPVVQQAPRTVVATPLAPAPAGPPPVPAAAPAPAPAAPPVPAPAPVAPPIVIPVPILPLLPSILQPPLAGTTIPRSPATTQTTPTATQTAPTETTTSTMPTSTTSAPVTSQTSPSTPTATESATTAATTSPAQTATEAPTDSGSGSADTGGGQDSGSGGAQSPDSPLWPLGD